MYEDLTAQAIRDGDNHALMRALANPMTDADSALQLAVRYDRLEMVEILIPYANAKAQDSYALTLAVMNENREIFDLLLPHSDPGKDKTLEAFQYACADQNEYIIGALTDKIGFEQARAKIVGMIDSGEKHGWIGWNGAETAYDLQDRLAKLDQRELATKTVTVPPSFAECVSSVRSNSEQQAPGRAVVRRL